jgi:hypothetical protein
MHFRVQPSDKPKHHLLVERTGGLTLPIPKTLSLMPPKIENERLLACQESDTSSEYL